MTWQPATCERNKETDYLPRAREPLLACPFGPHSLSNFNLLSCLDGRSHQRDHHWIRFSGTPEDGNALAFPSKSTPYSAMSVTSMSWSLITLNFLAKVILARWPLNVVLFGTLKKTFSCD